MTTRDLDALTVDGETEATVRSAIEALDDINPTSEAWRRRLAALRDELMQELRLLESQGSLF